jgi:hypothetical protein
MNLQGEHVMVSANGISRRHMLAISAAGGLALANSRVARAQAAKRIDQFAPDLDKVIATTEPILELATGFGGGGNTEGPVWWKEGGYLLFNSIGENRRIKYTPGQGTTVAKEPTNGANGLTRDPQGRLVSCEGLTRRVTREEADGSITVEQLPGPPPQQAQRRGGEVRRRGLLHRSLEHSGAAAAMGPHL